MSTDPEEVRFQVFRASGLRVTKPGHTRFRVVFGAGRKKLQTKVVEDSHGSPIWNTQANIVLHHNDRIIKFKVLDGDQVCGQIQLPVSQIPRSENEAYPLDVRLQRHKKCTSPCGSLVYCCFISKFRQLTVSRNCPVRVKDSEVQQINKECEPLTSGKGHSPFTKKFSSSMADLTSVEPTSLPAAKSRQNLQSKNPSAAKNGDQFFKSAINLVSENDAEVASSIDAVSIDFSPSMSTGLGKKSQLSVAYPAGVSNLANFATRGMSSTPDVSKVSPSTVSSKSLEPHSIMMSHGSSAYSSGSSIKSPKLVAPATTRPDTAVHWSVETLLAPTSIIKNSEASNHLQRKDSESRQVALTSAVAAKKPRVSRIDPAEGSVHGGTTLLVLGENLGDHPSDVRAVYVCGSNCTSTVLWHSSTELLVTTKPWRECTGCVIVETQHGRSNMGVQFSFRDNHVSAQIAAPKQPGTEIPASSSSRVVTSSPSTGKTGLAEGGKGEAKSFLSTANPLELISEISRLKSRVQELQMQNAQLRADHGRQLQYIDALMQKVLTRCPEILCTDAYAQRTSVADANHAALRKRSSSLFSLNRASASRRRDQEVGNVGENLQPSEIIPNSSVSDSKNFTNASQSKLNGTNFVSGKPHLMVNETISL